MIKDINADEGLIALKSLETMAKVADGRATKIIIPSKLQGLAGLAVSLNEMMKDDTDAKSPSGDTDARKRPN